MAEEPRGKSGTIRMDPGATLPDARPLRFADDVADADRADLASEAETPPIPPAKPAQPASDRQEFATGTARKAQGRTLELRSVDVSKADPRHAPTQQALRTIQIDPTVGVDSRAETPPPKRWVLLVGVAFAVVVFGVVAFYLRSRFAAH